MAPIRQNKLWVGILSCFLIHASPSFADKPPQENIPVAVDTSTKTDQLATLNVGVSFAIPPWVITENNSGIELDILKEALSPAGYEIKPNYVTYALSHSLFDSGELDVVLNAKKTLLHVGYLSEPVVTFQDVAVSLKDKNYPKNITTSFLKDKSVVAFQKASILLGDEFNEMTKQNDMYQEVAKQSLQVNQLMLNNINFIVMDKSIFHYYLQEAKNNPSLARAIDKLNQEVRLHYLFEPTHYRFAFKSKKVRDRFNAGLTKIKNNGIYDAIFKRYSHLSN